MQNVVVNMCEKIYNDRLRNDRALGNRKSDNNNNTNINKNNQNNVGGAWRPVSGSLSKPNSKMATSEIAGPRLLIRVSACQTKNRLWLHISIGMGHRLTVQTN